MNIVKAWSVKRGFSARAGSLAACLAAMGLLPGPAASTTTYFQGRVTSNAGSLINAATVGLDSGVVSPSSSASNGQFVIDGLLVGGRDRVTLLGSSIKSCVGPTLYTGTIPHLGRDFLCVDAGSLAKWAMDLDTDGTLDLTKGIVFGEVLSAVGAPVSGATVTLSLAGGSVYYFGSGVDPVPADTATGSNGRFLVLDVPPGPVTVTASSGAAVIGVAYGKVSADTVAALSPAPPATLVGAALDETGAAIGGAAVAWEFDPTIATASDGAGQFTLERIAQGLDVTLRGSAPGYKPALTFRRSFAEAGDLATLRVLFLSDANYLSYPAGFNVAQAPSKGVVLGHVLTQTGSALVGATVQVEPSGGAMVGYFNALGAPDPALLATSSSGRFAVFNVPAGNPVTLSALGPGETLRSVVAPSEAGSVTMGDIRGLPTVTLNGMVTDEFASAAFIGGAVVSVTEYPELAVSTDAGGNYTLPGVPMDEYLTLKVGRSDFKDTYTFITQYHASNLDCGGDSDEDGTLDRLDCQDLSVVSSFSYADIYAQNRSAGNRALGLVGAALKLSNQAGALGVTAQLAPPGGTITYLADGVFTPKFLTTIGALQILSARPRVSGIIFADERNDFTQLALLRLAPDSYALAPDIRVACDTKLNRAFANLYPCDGAKLTSVTSSQIFQWDDNERKILRSQVQFSTDPGFATIALTSHSSGGPKFLPRSFWQVKKKVWNKVKKLGPSGSAVYWRVLGLDVAKAQTTTAPFKFYLP